jgi:hypothetical protein
MLSGVAAGSAHQMKTAWFEHPVTPTEEPGVKSRHAVGHDQRGRERARKHRAVKGAIFGAEESGGQPTSMLTLHRTGLTPCMSWVKVPPTHHHFLRTTQGHCRPDVGPGFGREGDSCGVCDRVPGRNLRGDLDADFMRVGIAREVADQNAPGLYPVGRTRTGVNLRQHVIGDDEVDVGDIGLSTVV